MELSETSQQAQPVAEGRTLLVDFTWMKFKALVTDKDQASKPLYIVEFKTLSPHLVFTRAGDNSKFGTGTLHAISINADCDVHGQHVKLQAMKRFKTEYEHLSLAYSDTKDPVPLRWTSNCGFKTWDFVCLDPQQLPVAKFSANLWTTKKIGIIEFLGEKTAKSEALREEIVVTGLTLFYCMTLRSTNFLSFFGAIFSRPGHDKAVAAKNVS